MYIERNIKPLFHDFIKFFPVVAILGPRQSGKTTFVKHELKNYHYVNLENIGLREIIEKDPAGFLEKSLRYEGLIIDEFQNYPDLLSYIQLVVDENPEKKGFFILTGSQNFLMNQFISQSLAGRVGILTLLPLSNNELIKVNLLSEYAEQAIFKGFYPRIFENQDFAYYFYPSYIQTYIEKDVRSLVNVNNLTLFKRFLGLCAGRIGQILNLSSLANDCDISLATAKSWLSILEASYIVYLLQPYHKNFNKRLVKSPILYFYDTGVACSLLSIDSAEQLETHYMKGHLFENLVISDLQKQFFNHAKRPRTYFWRDSNGNEVDCIIEKDKVLPVEIKSSMTFSKSFLKGVNYWNKLSGETKAKIVYTGKQNIELGDIEITSWRNFNIFS